MALSAFARKTLRVASLFGDRFDADALVSILGDDKLPGVQIALRQLEDANLIATDPRSPEHIFYQFCLADARGRLPNVDPR